MSRQGSRRSRASEREVAEVVDDDGRPGTPELAFPPGLIWVRPIDADHHAELAVVAGGHAGQRVLHHHCSFRRHAEPAGCLQEHGRLGFAGQGHGLGRLSVHPDVHQLGQAGGLEHLGTMAAGRHHRDVHAQLLGAGRGGQLDGRKGMWPLGRQQVAILGVLLVRPVPMR